MASYEQNPKTKLWSARFRIITAGKEKNKRLSRWGDDIKRPPFRTKKEAERAYIEYAATVRLANQQAFSETTTDYRYDTLLDKYIEYIKIENRDSTVYDKICSFKKFVTPYFTGKDIRTLTKPILDDWQTTLWSSTHTVGTQEVKYAYNYLKKIRGFLHTFLEYCRYKYDTPNQLSVVRMPRSRETRKDIAFWELKEFNRFITHTRHDYVFETFCCFAFYTGLRLNEIRAFGEADLHDDTIHVHKSIMRKTLDGSPYRVEETKNYKNYRKTIPDILQDKLNAYITWKRENGIGSTFLFGGDKLYPEMTIRRHLDDCIGIANKKRARIKRITPHGFRHSYVAMLVHLGCSTKVIAELIGDTEEQILRTYSHLYSTDKNAAVNRINELVEKGTAEGTET